MSTSTSTMTYRRLGESGLRVSTFGLGGWTTYGGSVTDPSLVRSILRTAYERGVNFFDIADIYARGEAERAMGAVLRELPRHTLVISSKLFWPMSDDVNDRGLSRKHIVESIEATLRRLGTEYLDLYFCHRYDEETPLEETVRAMENLIRQGKILYWGTSEWTGAQIDEACELAGRFGAYRPQVEQPQYSLLARQRFETDTRPALKRHGLGAVIWSPLGSGVLTGKYDAGVPQDSRLGQIAWLREAVLTERNVDRVRRFKALAGEAGHSRAQLALAWAAAQDGVSSVITGATSIAQLEENLGALAITISGDLEARVNALFPVDPGV